MSMFGPNPSDEGSGDDEGGGAVRRERPKPSRGEKPAQMNRRATPIADFSDMTPELSALLAATCFPSTLAPPEQAAEAAARGSASGAALVSSVRRGSLASHGWFALELFDLEEYPTSGGASGLYLDVHGASKRKGAALIAWPAGGGVDGPSQGDMFGKGTWSVPDNQLWRHEKATGCLHSMLADEGVAHKGLVADVTGNSPLPGAKVVTWTATAKANQVFKVGKVALLEPWAPALPTMRAHAEAPGLRGWSQEDPEAAALESTTGRRVTPQGQGYDEMPPEVAALLLNTALPPQSESPDKAKGAKGAFGSLGGVGGGNGGAGGSGGGMSEGAMGHGGGLLVEIACSDDLGEGTAAKSAREGGAHGPMVLGVPTGVAVGNSRRQSTLQFRVNGPVAAGSEVVTVPASVAGRGAEGGFISRWRVVPVHPNIPLPMRRGS